MNDMFLSTRNGHTYIIAELGQNHQGSVDLAKALIDMAAMKVEHNGIELPGVDAVKLTKRDMTDEMTESSKHMPYGGRNAFAETYGAHRMMLELHYSDHVQLCKYAHAQGLQFVETICSRMALELLMNAGLEPDYIKLASRDLSNTPLVDMMAETKLPLILSTGMSSFQDIAETVERICKVHRNITVLHCTSTYPARYDELDMVTLHSYAKQWGDIAIGYSDHTTGVLAPAIAVACGAQVVEKHITLHHSMKGTDHAGSMDHEGLYRVVRDIRNTEKALGKSRTQPPITTDVAKGKLARSCALKWPMVAGTTITEESLCLLSPGTGIPWSERDRIIGRQLKCDIKRHELVKQEDVTNG